MRASLRAIPARLWVLSLLSAVFQILPFPITGPTPLWRRAFCWFCLTPLLWALLSEDKAGRALSAKQTTLLSYSCGVLWYLGNCYWIYPTMHVYGDIAAPVAIGILILFSMYVGLYHALFGYLIGVIRPYGRQWVLWASPVVWVGVELARSRVTGFPWDLLGYTQVENLTLTRLAPWTGVMGISLVVAAVNALWLISIRGRSRTSIYFGTTAAALVALVFTVLTGRGAPEVADYSRTAVLLQDNLHVGTERISASESKAAMLAAFTRLSEHPTYFASLHKMVDNYWPVAASGDTELRPADLVLWPEAPTDFLDGDPAFRNSLSEVARHEHAPLIVDDMSLLPPLPGQTHARAYGSATFFDAEGTYSGHYDKMHLVPFGEYTPYKQVFFFAGHLLDNVGGFTPGEQRVLFRTGGHQYGTFICYESIFGDEVREFAKDGAELLVNLSDDGWYGDSSAPWEHLDMVRMRAIENDRWVLRATNTGVTGAIDPYGRLVAQMPRHVRGSVLVPFGFETKLTFYTRHGDWIGWLCAGLTAGLAAVALLRRRQVH